MSLQQGLTINNPFALLDITNCTNNLSRGGVKMTRHIANIIKPLIKQIESEVDMHNKKSLGIVYLVFYGASNVQNDWQNPEGF